jgi:hypothetical protein
MKRLYSCWFLLIPACCYALQVVPDSVSKSVHPMLMIDSALDSVFLKNNTAATVIVDSIVIRFLDGDSLDFSRGSDCRPSVYYDYVYRGWTYGLTYETLRYMRDSLFLLQDSAGNPISLSIGPNDSALFTLYIIINCPICGRMPAFPATTRYLYTFHTSTGTSADLAVTVVDLTSTRRDAPGGRRAPVAATGSGSVMYNVLGQRVAKSPGMGAAILLGKGMTRIGLTCFSSMHEKDGN